MQDDEKYKVYESAWTKAMEELENNNNIAEALPWLPLPDMRSVTATRPTTMEQTSRNNIEHRVREIVPQVVHADWSQKDKKRANEVNVSNKAEISDCNPRPWQVQNAVFEGLHVYKVEDIIKRHFAAVYAIDIEENAGLPFWIGKVNCTIEASEAVTDEFDESIDNGDTQWHVKIEEYIQQQKGKGAKAQWSGIYKPLKVHGAQKQKSKATAAKAVYTTVPIEQVAYIFEELTLAGMLNKTTKEWVSFRCEIASRLRVYDCPGVAEFNKVCGYKMMPYA